MRLPIVPLVLLFTASPLVAQRMSRPVPFTAYAPNSVAGSYQIVTRGARHWIRLSDDFETRGAPDAIIYLTVGGVVDSTALEVAEIKDIGGGVFPIPDGTNISLYDTIIIWSNAHGEALARARLRRTRPRATTLKR
ncbi:MAG: DM13 domain-containing protein [Gemmatimonadales bacterium]